MDVRPPSRLFNAALACALLTLSAPSRAEATITDCLKAARALRAGQVMKVEYLAVSDEHQAAYEIEIKPPSGRTWEFECGVEHGAILEMQQQVASADDPLFKRGAKVDRQRAVAAATAVYPGEVEEIQYELDAHGQPRYEVDLVDVDSVRFKIEVSAVSGQIEEMQIEAWQIGPNSAPP